MKLLQIIIDVVLVIWMVVTTCFYLVGNAFEKENSAASGYDLFLKYTPRSWQIVSFLVVPITFVLYFITLFFTRK